MVKRRRSIVYPTLREAERAARKLGIRKKADYQLRYREDPYLPGDPAKRYSSEWSGWRSFLGTGFYKNYDAARLAAQRLGLSGQIDYRNRYKQDPRLPSDPAHHYRDQWRGWRAFCGREFYKTYQQAARAARKLGVTSAAEYKFSRYRDDSRLPSDPRTHYADEWVSWSHFLCGRQPYPTLREAAIAARSLGIRTKNQYRRCYKCDPSLPSAPELYYMDEWAGWGAFLRDKDTTDKGNDSCRSSVSRAENPIALEITYP